MKHVRVDYRQGKATTVAGDQLQDKSKRYYYSETMQLQEREIYLSPFDLNIEHKQLETPLKPMLRVATPVFDRQRQRRGIIIINYCGQILFEAFQKVFLVEKH
ncbi:MAG: hypothetical protein GQ559_07795 [Desulfobulbaceae bacterium]|nr:hypothetical protein [Desulfobulbaceae bacterium]